MTHRPAISRAAWILLGMSAALAGAGVALPHLRPVPTVIDADLIALRSERDALASNDDTTLENLRQQFKTQPPAAWTTEKFMERVGTDWRVEWQQPSSASRAVRLTRSAPHLNEWPAYLKFVKFWTTQPGVVLESLDVTAKGTALTRKLDQVVVDLRATMSGAPIGNVERDAPSRVPLPVAAAEEVATPRKIGPGPSLRRPSASAQPPAPRQASAPVRPDPPGAGH